MSDPNPAPEEARRKAEERATKLLVIAAATVERFNTNAFEPLKHHADRDLMRRLVASVLLEGEQRERELQGEVERLTTEKEQAEGQCEAVSRDYISLQQKHNAAERALRGGVRLINQWRRECAAPQEAPAQPERKEGDKQP